MERRSEQQRKRVQKNRAVSRTGGGDSTEEDRRKEGEKVERERERDFKKRWKREGEKGRERTDTKDSGDGRSVERNVFGLALPLSSCCFQVALRGSGLPSCCPS